MEGGQGPWSGRPINLPFEGYTHEVTQALQAFSLKVQVLKETQQILLVELDTVMRESEEIKGDPPWTSFITCTLAVTFFIWSHDEPLNTNFQHKLPIQTLMNLSTQTSTTNCHYQLPIPTEKYNAATLASQETNTELSMLRQERATLDIQVVDTPYQPTMSTHVVNRPRQHTLSIHPRSQPTPS